jgi:acyl-CoA reductase-like NAD-dependent aldehyde dehydrogenase
MAITQNTETHITAINPATTEVLGRVKISSSEEINVTVANAHQAFSKWRNLPVAERLRYIRRFHDHVFQSRDRLAETITKETGKPLGESLVSEIYGVLETCAWLEAHAERWLKSEPVRLNKIFLPGKTAYNVYEPLGVIAVISPWNYPFSIPVSSMVAALAAGNAVVLKPSPKTALIAEAIQVAFRDAGLPEGLVGLVQGDRVEAEALINSRINRIMFTGSVGGGKAIAGLAAKKLLPTTLELGGKHAAIVLADSDIDSIARPLVWSAFTNAGQACASIERMYVERSIAKRLEERIAALTKQLRLGNGLLPDTDVGPLIDESQIGRIKDQIASAVADGARVIAGGNERLDLGGFFFEPTVLTDVKQGMRIIREEIFGPVLPIIEVADEREAIALANDSDLGLGASVWTRDTKRGERIAREIEAGMVWVNDGLYTHVSPDAPWGGIKESGYGRMHSAAELRDLVYVKNIGINKQRAQDWNYPYSATSLDYIRGGIEILHGAVADKVKGIQRVMRFLMHKRQD